MRHSYFLRFLIFFGLTFSLESFSQESGFKVHNNQTDHRQEADLTRPVLSTFQGTFDLEGRNIGGEQRLCPVLKTKDQIFRLRTYTDRACTEQIKKCQPGTPCLVKGEIGPEGDLWVEEFLTSTGSSSKKLSGDQLKVEECFSLLRKKMSQNWFDEQLWAACLGADPDCVMKQCRANKELYPEDFVEACGGIYDPNHQPTWDVSHLKQKSFRDPKPTSTPLQPRPPAVSRPPIGGGGSSSCQFFRAEATGRGPIHNGFCGYFPGSGPHPWSAEAAALNNCRLNAGRSPHGEVCQCIISTPARCAR